MAVAVIQPAFAAGELAPSLYGRVDLAKYHVGAATMRNMFVDYKGGEKVALGLVSSARASNPEQAHHRAS